MNNAPRMQSEKKNINHELKIIQQAEKDIYSWQEWYDMCSTSRPPPFPMLNFMTPCCPIGPNLVISGVLTQTAWW